MVDDRRRVVGPDQAPGGGLFHHDGHLLGVMSFGRQGHAGSAVHFAFSIDAVRNALTRDKVSWRGDLRYRHEMVDPEEAVNDQTRHRVRARFGRSGRQRLARPLGEPARATRPSHAPPAAAHRGRLSGESAPREDWRAAGAAAAGGGSQA
ncbi:MAG: hypothetical protein HC774_07445 [Sphingomonadales bacterium]|nr:hypothetical protein [Sphingomonadales bacterium]